MTRWPETRGRMVVGFFLLTVMNLLMIRENPALLANASFMQLSQTLMTGGLLLAASFYFQREKSPPDAGSVLVTPPADVTVTTEKPL